MIELLLLFVVIANIFWFFVLLSVNSREQRIARRVNEEVGLMMAEAEEMLRNTLLLRCEKHNNALFLYNAKTEEFVCQGNTVEELSDAFSKRFPNQRAIIGEGNEYIFKEKMNVAK